MTIHPTAQATIPAQFASILSLREERALLARLLGDAITARNHARGAGAVGDDLSCHEALVSRLLARTAAVDTRLLRARIELETQRGKLEARDRSAELAPALGIAALD